MLLGPILTFDAIIPNHPYILTFSAGTVPAVVNMLGIEFTKLGKNRRDILEACHSYSNSF
jgi:hypothetical protein